jgi:hypothetical protein
MTAHGERPTSKGNTKQHSVRATDRLWGAYRNHRESMDSNASEGLRLHMIRELDQAGKLTPDMLAPDAPQT